MFFIVYLGCNVVQFYEILMYLGCNIVIIGILVYLHFTVQTIVFDLISHSFRAL